MRNEELATLNGLRLADQPIRYPSRSVRLLERLQKTADQDGQLASRALVPLNVVIVGAGLGGLATAVALARRGHTVTILEQAPALGEVGAGIQIPPNSARLLLSWGIGPYFKGRVVEPDSMTFRRWQNGDPIGYTRLVPDFPDAYGAPYLVIHRADFHSALCRLAEQHGVQILTDSRVVAYDEAAPAVTTADGRTFAADLVVGADGVKSLARPVVLGGTDRLANKTGFAVYRAVVDTAKIQADADTAWLLEKPGINIWIGPDRHVMTYSIAGGNSFNMVLSHVDHSDPASWTPADAVAEMRGQFAGWDPRLNKVIAMIESTIKWPLMSGARLPTWIAPSRRLVLLGDAAHAMVPYMSQGAAMAVEDGAALAEVLSLVPSRDQLPDALAVFEQERMQRSGGMQTASLVNGRLWHFADGPEQEARDRGSRAEVEGRPFLESTNQWSDPVTQVWAYGYDAEAEARERWKARK
ncbi:salicylate hydroxylase [Grosmannia clavigera kw1407]|uniref:Salicylate hydroxylase n=1 Tax=Grosmannia clavigera (strain kw1407 / UAMH 11150) TaxID=655863 RepID=F0XIP7_GROCL|nr:salicylate hydroxylase [Grosmannia clavigera kw1407]EFX02321.1 salicylate hydroxylase [Grosmannia clavigera kw1407]